ncbi:MAG TPA: HD domain-containing phosphohydrolase [Pyrinomonadaceae bacterium]|nr:HD domain-containing phosphohydrolase [Pyrinomonadaceae bacterium]
MSETLGRRSRVLIADDEPEIRAVLAELLQKSYDCEAVSSGEAALERLGRREFDLIISDIMMGGMTGLDLIPHARRLAPDAVVVMISGVQTVESAIGALRAGAFDYVMKPFDLEHVEAAVVRALEHQSLRASKRRYENYLEEMVAQRTAELDRALRSLEDAYRTTLKALTAALETRDAETHGHSERVVNFSLRLGRELGLDAERLMSLEFGSLLHDIGKIGVPDAILRKPAKLDEGEWIKMREHPLHGQRILCGIEFLEGAARVVAQHHERWDGSGYPAGLRGEQIDLNARIFSVADAFDAMVSDRVYRRGRPYEEAAAELERFAGSQFDPEVVAAFHRVPREEWDEIRRRSVEIGEPKQEAAGRLEGIAHGLLIEPDNNALVN